MPIRPVMVEMDSIPAKRRPRLIRTKLTVIAKSQELVTKRVRRAAKVTDRKTKT